MLFYSIWKLDPTGNNHQATELQEVTTDRAKESGDDDDDNNNSAFKAKERSILQAKLTKLAIQIGYAGMTIAILTVLVLLLRFSIEEFVQR